MTVALIDNGSLEPAAYRNLRGVAARLSERCGVSVQAVSCKHSDRIRPLAFAGHRAGASSDVPLQPDGRAWTLAPWLRAQLAAGEREFLFVPFFISAQGAIGSALRNELENLQAKFGPFAFRFTRGLGGDGTLVRIMAARIRDVIATQRLHAPAVIVVDHGGPSPTSAALRNETAAGVQRELGSAIGPLGAASLEGAEYGHSQPLLAAQFGAPGFDRGDVIVAPLFLAPGRHAGPHGDLVQIARAAGDRLVSPPLRCHFSELVGTHPLAAGTLAAALNDALLNGSPPPAAGPRSAGPQNVLPAEPIQDFQSSPLSA